jgi:TonB family protein
MNEAATDIIAARARDTERLSTMLMWSIAAHVVLGAFALLMPASSEAPPRNVMMISLGGAIGPDTGGMTQIGGRPVQAPPPEEPVRRAETAPAPVPPPMTVPEPRTPPQPPRARPQQAPREATGRTPTTGPEPTEGSTRADTGNRGQGFGLSTAGGGGDGGVRLDVDFCCPGYIGEMTSIIKKSWNPRQGIVGITTMMFTIQRDGTLTGVQVEKTSGFTILDTAAQRALAQTRLPPLPREFGHSTLTVHMEFEYQR